MCAGGEAQNVMLWASSAVENLLCAYLSERLSLPDPPQPACTHDGTVVGEELQEVVLHRLRCLGPLVQVRAGGGGCREGEVREVGNWMPELVRLCMEWAYKKEQAVQLQRPISAPPTHPSFPAPSPAAASSP